MPGYATAADDLHGIHPGPLLPQEGWLTAAALAGGALALIFVCLIVFLLRRPAANPPSPAGGHDPRAPRQAWMDRVEAVVARHDKGVIDRDAAMEELAKIARGFASQAWNEDMSSRTLSEIMAHPRDQGNKRGLDLLRQTIDALYPPEFASPVSTGTTPTVREAADWVSSLIGRWR